MPISDATRQLVRERADYLCEYCHSLERLSANRFTIDHIIPRSLCGSDDLENLALACRRCNDERYPEEDSIRGTRRFWIRTKLHPPPDDPVTR